MLASFNSGKLNGWALAAVAGLTFFVGMFATGFLPGIFRSKLITLAIIVIALVYFVNRAGSSCCAKKSGTDL